MTTTIPNPPANPIPYTSTFEGDMTAWLAWLTDNASKFGDVAGEVNDALNTALLGVTSTSTSSITIANTGTINITVEANKGYAIAMTVKIASVANPANYVKGAVTAYSKTTGAMSVLLNSKGGSGTFANWSVFFDVQDQINLSVPTGEVVPAGTLLGVDDAGNSIAVDSAASATILASNVTMMTTFPMAGDKTGILFTVGTADLRFMSVNKDRTVSQPSLSIGTILNSGSTARGCELSNGNIAICFSDTGTQYPAVKVISPAGLDVVAKTNPESVALSALPQVAALSGGGFAMTWSTGSFTRYIVYTNTMGITKAMSNVYGGTSPQVGIVSSPGGGFMTYHSNNPYVQWFDAAGNLAFSRSMNLSQNSDQVGFVDAGNFSLSFYVTASLGLVMQQVSKTGAQDLSGGCQVRTPDPYVFTNTYVTRAIKLGNGNTLVIGALSGTRAFYAIITPQGNFVKGGTLTTEPYQVGADGMHVTPIGTNGFAVIYRAATTGNLKMFVVKSGKLMGISAGQVGAVTNYITNGAVSVASDNVLNVGDESINFIRQGARVVM